MSFTRDELVTEIRALADAENETRWSNTTVLRHLDIVFDREWSRILAADPFYNVSSVSVTPDSNGVVARSAITGGTGDSLQRLYRIIGVVDGRTRFTKGDLDENLLTTDYGPQGTTLYRYWRKGSNLILYPPPASATVTFSYRPQLPKALSSGDVTVTFPEPFEMLLAYGTAAQMLAKGGSETGASAELNALAEPIRDDLLADLSRDETEPTTWKYSDDPSQWMG